MVSIVKSGQEVCGNIINTTDRAKCFSRLFTFYFAASSGFSRFSVAVSRTPGKQMPNLKLSSSSTVPGTWY